MKAFMVLSFTFLVSFPVFAQLDPFYYGTYTNNNGTEVFTLYTMDEVADDCFIVDYHRIKDHQLILVSYGYGHVDREGGQVEFYLENYDRPLKVDFNIDYSGHKILKVYMENGSFELFKESEESVSSSDETNRIFFYSKKKWY